MLNANGILIQGLDEHTDFINNFVYDGINAYFRFPLTAFCDSESRDLTSEQQSKKISGDSYAVLEFISDYGLYERYVKKCNELGIKFRALFIESKYSEEIWSGQLPKKEFIGYEYCPIPIDEQIITDMDWYEPFSKYQKLLNEYGLFRTYSDAEKFSEEYTRAFNEGKVGDGEENNYICKVYLIK